MPSVYKKVMVGFILYFQAILKVFFLGTITMDYICELKLQYNALDSCSCILSKVKKKRKVVFNFIVYYWLTVRNRMNEGLQALLLFTN